VLKSTGGAANVTAKQIGALATAISNKVGIDDEAIQSGANLLLTFKNVRNEAGKGNDIFNQSVGVITDMSAALGQDMKSRASSSARRSTTRSRASRRCPAWV
jgi:acid phosphatase family membrane protein YuiD